MGAGLYIAQMDTARGICWTGVQPSLYQLVDKRRRPRVVAAQLDVIHVMGVADARKHWALAASSDYLAPIATLRGQGRRRRQLFDGHYAEAPGACRGGSLDGEILQQPPAVLGALAVGVRS